MRPCFRILSIVTSNLSMVNYNYVLLPLLRVQFRTSVYLRLYLYGELKRTFSNHRIKDCEILNRVVMVLQNKFRCSEQEANTIVQALEVESLEDLNSVLSTAYLLNVNGLHKYSLLAFPWILEWRSDSLSCSIPFLKKFHADLNVTLPLIQIPLDKLAKFSVIAELDKPVVESRITFVSKALQCHPLIVSRSFVKYRFMFSLPLNRLMTVLDILKEAEFPPDVVLNDMWVFQHNINVMRERLNQAKEAGVLLAKPWSLRCEVEVFNRMLKKKAELLNVVGPNMSLDDYLSRKLNCNLSEVSYVNSKIPPVSRTSCARYNKLLDYLYNEGFTPKDVLKMPRVLCRSLETVQSRLKDMKEIGYEVKSLYVVCLTTREYKKFVDKLKANKLKEPSK